MKNQNEFFDLSLSNMVGAGIDDAGYFDRFPENITQTAIPTHLIVSGFLRLSKTFEIYRRAFAELGMTDVFVPHELPLVGGMPDTKGLRALIELYRGNPAMKTLVISDPYKQAILPLLDLLEPRARVIGAVNFIFKRGDKIVGDNLDGEAFVLGVQNEIKFDFNRRAMVFFGCGGVSSAVSMSLAAQLSRVALIDVQVERAEALAGKLLAANKKLKIAVHDRSSEIDMRRFDVFYNGTGLGKETNQNAFLLTPIHAFDMFPEEGLAFDANYIPAETAFLRRFGVMGFTTLNGFSHMIAFTSLHLSHIAQKKVAYQSVRDLAPSAKNASVWQ